MKTSGVLLLLLAIMASVYADTIDLVPNQWLPNIFVSSQAWTNFYKLAIPANTREVRVRMDKTSAAGVIYDPDLYVRFDEIPDKHNYDERDDTHLEHHEVSSMIADRAVKPLNALIGIYGHMGEGLARLRGDTYSCLNRNCGHEDGAGNCDAATGECTCQENFTAFPDCSAKTTPVDFNVDVDGTLERGKTLFYKYAAPAVVGGSESMIFTVERTATSAYYSGYALRVQRGRFPTEHDYLFESYGSQTIQRVAVPPSEYSEGAWYVSVTSTFAPLSFTMKSQVFTCPNNCSNHGTCTTETGVCTCEPGYEFARDCSVKSDTLKPNEPQALTILPRDLIGFVAEVSKQWAEAPVELGIHLDITDAPANVVLPTVYIKHGEKPSDTKYDFVSRAPTAVDGAIYIPKTQLKEGKYYVLIQNTEAVQFKASVTWYYHRDCPTECNTNGRCSATGVCICNEGFYGTDCSIRRSACEYVEPPKPAKQPVTVETTVAIFIAFAVGVATLVGTLFAAKKFFPAPQQPTPEINFNG